MTDFTVIAIFYFAAPFFFLEALIFFNLFRRSIFVWRHQFPPTPPENHVSVTFLCLKKKFASSLAPFLQEIDFFLNCHFFARSIFGGNQEQIRKKSLTRLIFFCYDPVIHKINLVWPKVMLRFFFVKYKIRPRFIRSEKGWLQE